MYFWASFSGLPSFHKPEYDSMNRWSRIQLLEPYVIKILENWTNENNNWMKERGENSSCILQKNEYMTRSQHFSMVLLWHLRSLFYERERWNKKQHHLFDPLKVSKKAIFFFFTICIGEIKTFLWDSCFDIVLYSHNFPLPWK